MLGQTVERNGMLTRVKAAHLAAILVVAAVLLLGTSPLLAQASTPPWCDIIGTWYGGSTVAYQMTVIPAVAPDHYTVVFQGMYKNSVMNTAFTGELVKKHNRYEGPLMQLTTGNPAFLNPPPVGELPDIIAAWTSIELVNCNTIRNTIPFFGLYAGAGIWQPGESGAAWITSGKTPLLHPPDVDLLDVITGGVPIVESYHRLVRTVNPALLHKLPASTP